MILKPEEQLDIIKRNTAEIISEEELFNMLKESCEQNRPLKIKLGLDPTAPDIHLGHAVVLKKLREFQDLGHQVVIIIGDFTGMIGDPTGRSETRKQLTKEEIAENARTYEEQVFKILDKSKTEIAFNSEWLREMTFEDVIRLASKYTLARILEREDFTERFKKGNPISLHEFLYPLMQGYDSVTLESNVEMGATEQKFNLLVGRTLQKEYGQTPQVALMMPILVGIDGTRKMSKSFGNYIGISESPDEIYGKAMSIPDEVMFEYFRLASDYTIEEIDDIQAAVESGSLHPRDAKMKLARSIVRQYHGNEASIKAENNFIKVFQKGNMPDEIDVFKLDSQHLNTDGTIWLPKLMKLAGLTTSTSEGQRLISQGAVKIDEQKIEKAEDIKIVSETIIQIGKRKFMRIEIK
jgi:tyrosyl-tRNA synthetase